MSYVERIINLQFDLGGTQTFADGSKTAFFKGLQISATISKAGAVGLNNLNLRVYGLTPDVANTLSTLGKLLTSGRNNIVTVFAGDAVNGTPVAFVGTIQQAWQDFAGAPNVALTLTAFTGGLQTVQPTNPNTFAGSVDVATVLAQLASSAGWQFENNKVSVQLTNPYFSGTVVDQIKRAAAQANINYLIDDTAGTVTLAIWPKDGTRDHDIPVISKDTGMVDYPTWTENGILVKMLYNPQLIFGSQMKVQSVVTVANGTWQIFSLTHEIESQTDKGKWFTTAQGTILGHAAVAP